MAAVLAFLKISAAFPVTRFMSQFQTVRQQFNQKNTSYPEHLREMQLSITTRNRQRLELSRHHLLLGFDHFFQNQILCRCQRKWSLRSCILLAVISCGFITCQDAPRPPHSQLQRIICSVLGCARWNWNSFIEGGHVSNCCHIMAELAFLKHISLVARCCCGKCQVMLSSRCCCLSKLWYLYFMRMDLPARTHAEHNGNPLARIG